MGRVGRNNDSFKRIIIKGVNLIDEDKKVAYHSNLMDYYKDHGAKTFKVSKPKVHK